MKEIKLEEQDITCINAAVEHFYEESKAYTRQELQTMLDDDLLLIMDTPVKKLQEVSRTVSKLRDMQKTDMPYKLGVCFTGVAASLPRAPEPTDDDKPMPRRKYFSNGDRIL